MAQSLINDGDKGLLVRQELNAMFTELYNTIVSYTVDQDIIQNSINPVAGGAVYSGLAPKVDLANVIDALTSYDTAKVLSANQGRVLKGIIDALTTSNIPASGSRLYVTATQLDTINNTSGINTGDETKNTILTKLGKASTTASGYLDVDDFNIFNNKQGAIGYTPENQGYKELSVLDDSIVKYPCNNVVTSALTGKVTANTAIAADSKTKITYDAKGLVTGGDNATTADIVDSTDKRYVTDDQLTVIGNTSGTNTGDETRVSIEGKLGVPDAMVTTLSHLVIDTVANVEAGTYAATDIVFCIETQTFYSYLESGSAYTVDDKIVLSTAASGDTRLIGFSGVFSKNQLINEKLGTKDASFTKSFNDNFQLYSIEGKFVSGTPIIKVGTTESGEEIMSDTTVTTSFNYVYPIDFTASTTLYITISSGSLKINFKYYAYNF